MGAMLKSLLGDGPYPYPISDMNGRCGIDSFLGQGMIVLSTTSPIIMPRGSHAHQSYEFLIPSTDMPNTLIGKKITGFEKNRLIPINSEQPHGPIKEILECSLIGIHIQSTILNDISDQFCKKRDIIFDNEGVAIDHQIPLLINMFMEETKNSQTGSEFIQQNIVNLIVINLLRRSASNIPKLITEKNYYERDNIKRAADYLKEEYNNEFSLEDVARVANLSQYHFIRAFKAATGKTPYDFLLDIKINKSKELLNLKKFTITEVCFMCGFHSPGHFSAVFKRKVGILPSQYKKGIESH
jgi:AraC family transcriptional regulator